MNQEAVVISKSNYSKYRGKCKQFVGEAIKKDPTLKAVRGYYSCPLFGKQEHWWCVRPDGSIYDPTVKQFPTAGAGATYEEFDGWCICAECGKRFKEGKGQMQGPYPVCSGKCAKKLVGL